MTKLKVQEKLILSEFNFIVHIKSKENNDFYFIKDKICKSYSRYFNLSHDSYKQNIEFSNIPFIIINESFDKHFRFLGDGKAYLSNYSEKEGSFVMEFTVLILKSAIAYGGIRETIDYFADDLKNLFSNFLPIGFDTKVNFNEKIRIKKIKNKKTINNYFQKTQKQILLNRILIGFIFFLIIIEAIYLTENHDNNDYVTKQQFETLKEKVLSNQIKEVKVEIEMNKLKKDSINKSD